MHRIFILSPAKTSGKRASILMNERAEFELARKLRSSTGVPLGDVFSFLSGLYFRGKLAYSQNFALPPKDSKGVYVITSDAGLMSAGESISLARLKAFGNVPIDPLETRYTQPLRDSIYALQRCDLSDCEVVLLGSIASNKYSTVLLEAFGNRLMFPREFIGRGDMSRGGLLLRAVRAEQELEYGSLATAEAVRGKRPPKLPPLRKAEARDLGRPHQQGK